MRIAFVSDSVLPAIKYGGIERIVWWLAKQLSSRGHEVTLMAPPGSSCPFARVIARDPRTPLSEQIPNDVDIVHLQGGEVGRLKTPCLATFQCNAPPGTRFDRNTVFISRNQAQRHGGSVYVYNGIDPEEYGKPVLNAQRKHLLFLAKAAWKVKNVAGAIQIARRARRRLAVAGGRRINFNMGPRITLDPNVRFHGMVGGEQKNRLINQSSALLFPVVWHEPFGIAVIEALYFGCPVFATKWGALPELVHPQVGVLSNSHSELVAQLAHVEQFDRRACHEYVCDCFSARIMADRYLQLYERVLDGETLHTEPPVSPGAIQAKRFRMAA
jgi:glycosyltransferase involved in cell wall biosynthesis